MSQLLDAIDGVPNACEPIHGIVTGGQPTLEHLAALKRAGCEVVIVLREPMEPQPFRPAAVTKAGLEYCNIPVASASVPCPTGMLRYSKAGLEYRNIPVGHGTLADATFAWLLDAARDLAGKRPALIYCSSGNRVGVALIPYFMLEQGMEEEDAVTAAMRVGMRSAELMAQALEYVRSRQGI